MSCRLIESCEKTKSCHAAVMSSTRDNESFLIHAGVVGLKRISVFRSYQSHARVSLWVSTRTSSLWFGSWFRMSLLSAAPYWTINSCCNPTACGTFLPRISSVLCRFSERRHGDAGNRTPDRSDVGRERVRLDRTQPGLRRVKGLHGNRLYDSPGAKVKPHRWSEKQDAIWTGELPDQVFDAAGSLQVGTARRAHGWFRTDVSPGLLCLFFTVSQLKIKGEEEELDERRKGWTQSLWTVVFSKYKCVLKHV